MAAPSVSAVDLFCGAGGLAHGLKQAGVQVRAGYDLDELCRHPYEHNNGGTFVATDVARVTSTDLLPHFDSAFSLLAGCAPCQPFSLMNSKRLRPTDERWPLLGEFARLTNSSRPDFVTMENVPGLQSTTIFQSFIEVLQKRGYDVKHDVFDCSRLGVPQRRHRLVLVASRRGPARLPTKKPGPAPSVRGSIAPLRQVAAGIADEKDPLHRSPKLSATNLKRIQHSKPGGTWLDWPSDLRLDCHKKASGASYSESYGRMSWDKPAPTITTKFYNLGSGRFGHPEQDRALTLREGAMLQTFPATYEFFAEGAEVNLADVGRLIGNAVPVSLGRAVGEAVLAMAAEA